MDENELYNLLACLCRPKGTAFAVIAGDEFDKIKFEYFPCFIVFNTSSRRLKFGHWLAAFLVKIRHGIHVEVFDPLGKKLEDYSIAPNFVVNIQNTRAIQSDYSQECGPFVLMWINCRLNNISTRQFLNLFSQNVSLNDPIAQKFIWRLKRCCKRNETFSSDCMCSIPFVLFKSYINNWRQDEKG